MVGALGAIVFIMMAYVSLGRGRLSNHIYQLGKMVCNIIMKVSLPWPDKKCSPNARVNWRVLHEARKKRKRVGFMLSAGLPKINTKRLAMTVIFNPPDKRHYDLDNLLASIKGELDGIAQRIGVDDKNFRPITIDFGQVVKGGSVEIEYQFMECTICTYFINMKPPPLRI